MSQRTCTLGNAGACRREGRRRGGEKGPRRRCHVATLRPFIARTRKPKHRFRPTPDSLILSLLVGEAPLALRSARLADTAQGLRFVDVPATVGLAIVANKIDERPLRPTGPNGKIVSVSCDHGHSFSLLTSYLLRDL